MTNKKCKINKLKYFPISFLGTCLGLNGFALTWQKAEHTFNLPFSISNYLLYFSLIIIAIVLILYSYKMFKYPKEVKKEFNHPIIINFYPILAKLFLVTSIMYFNLNILSVSKYLLYTGVIIQSIFTIIIMSVWIRHEKFEIHHINPAWFIPVVGCILIPIAGTNHFPSELSWFFFSIGFFWWLILTTIIFNRIIFHKPISKELLPTLFILFAPPVLGFIALTKLLGGLTPQGNMLYYFSVFLFILIMFQAKLFVKIKFNLPWWAYSFPLEALVLGTLLMYEKTNFIFFNISSWILFIFLNILIVVLIIKTMTSINDKALYIEEKD